MSDWISLVSEAVGLARLSPCRSKRGVLVLDAQGEIVGGGWNDQPRGFHCDGSEACKQVCGKTAIHAEQSAILTSDSARLLDGSILHVKAVDVNGEFVAASSGDPSCLECSKLILFAGLKWVYLLHWPAHRLGEYIADIPGFISEMDSLGLLHLVRYDAVDFHCLTVEGKGIEVVRPRGPQMAQVGCEKRVAETGNGG